MPGEAFTEVREHAKRQGTNVSEQRHSSAGQAAHRGHTTANAPGNRRLPRGPRSAPARATTWQQEPPPRLSLPGNKRAVGSSHQARAGKCFRQLPRRPRVPRRGGAAGPHTLPCRSRTLGLLRLAGPAPTAGPCRRPVCLPPPRTRPPPRFLAARAAAPPPRRDDREAAAPTSPFTLLLREQREWGIEARNPQVPEMQRKTLKKGRPARLRLRPPFCTA